MKSADKRINKIVMKRFRGATNQSEIIFDPHKSVVMIYGENGSGKSSIVDALDFVCNQTGGSITDRSSTKLKDHLPAIGHKAKDVVVQVYSENDVWSAGFDTSKIHVSGNDAPPPVFILRRSRLSSLIESTPSERYKQLQRFIDVEAIERSEQSLRDALRIAETTYNQQSQAKMEAEALLERYWNDEGCPGAPVQNALGWASKQSSVDLQYIDFKQDRIREILSKLDKLIATAENYLQAELNAADKNIELSRVKNSIEQQKDVATLGTVEAIELLDLLRDAKKYMTATGGEQVDTSLRDCPVCEQPIVVTDLIHKIDERLRINSVSVALSDNLHAAENAVQKANAVIDRDRNDMVASARALYPVVKENGNVADRIVSVFKFDEWNEDKTSELKELLEILIVYRDSVVRERDENQKTTNQLNSIKQFYRRIGELAEELVDAEIQRNRLKQTLDLVHQQRIDFTQRILSEVKAETNRLYFAIHPDEPLGLDELKMDEAKKASLLQVCNFEGYDNVVPQAYYSDAHLDTLGFCLWLAVTKFSSNGDAIIVLDDIFTSLDEKHFDAVMDVLVSESQFFNQVIVTTHHRTEINGDVNFVELQNWSIKNGIQIKKAGAWSA